MTEVLYVVLLIPQFSDLSLIPVYILTDYDQITTDFPVG